MVKTLELNAWLKMLGHARSSGVMRISPSPAIGQRGGAIPILMLALNDRLEFEIIFIPESNHTLVHLAQAIKEYRNIDFMILVLVLKRLEPAVKKSIFYAVD